MNPNNFDAELADIHVPDTAAMPDWTDAGYDLDAALRLALRDADTASADIHRNLHDATCVDFMIERRTTERGITLQQVTVLTDDGRLITWSGRDGMDETGAVIAMLTIVRSIRTAVVAEAGCQIEHRRDDSGEMVRVVVVGQIHLTTLDDVTERPHECNDDACDANEHGGSTVWRVDQDVLMFAKSREDHGPAQMARLVSFMATVGRLANVPR